MDASWKKSKQQLSLTDIYVEQNRGRQGLRLVSWFTFQSPTFQIFFSFFSPFGLARTRTEKWEDDAHTTLDQTTSWKPGPLDHSRLCSAVTRKQSSKRWRWAPCEGSVTLTRTQKKNWRKQGVSKYWLKIPVKHAKINLPPAAIYLFSRHLQSLCVFLL